MMPICQIGLVNLFKQELQLSLQMFFSNTPDGLRFAIFRLEIERRFILGDAVDEIINSVILCIGQANRA